MSSSPRAVLWDLDGTIIDSEEYWIAAEVELANAHDAAWTHEDGLWQVGQGLPVTAQAMINKGVNASIPDIIDFLAASVLTSLQRSIPWRPGAVDLLQSVASTGTPQALVTMSVSPIAAFIASSIPGVQFDAVISGDTAQAQKPDPAPYRQACALLGVHPHETIAIEDSPSGIQSAYAAGAHVLGVRHLVDIEQTNAATLWDSLRGSTASQLFAILQQGVDS